MVFRVRFREESHIKRSMGTFGNMIGKCYALMQQRNNATHLRAHLLACVM